MKIIHRTIVSALIFSKDKKLFMGMKDPNSGGVYLDCWHIPGGGIDEGEDPLTALKRELVEEVGLHITNDQATFLDDTGEGESLKIVNNEEVLCKMKFIVYKVQLDQDANAVTLSLDDDLVKGQWFKIDELHDYKLTPPSEKFFRKIGYIR